ncbi:unnamed protein product [Parajaminaea phylloscopi]
MPPSQPSQPGGPSPPADPPTPTPTTTSTGTTLHRARSVARRAAALDAPALSHAWTRSDLNAAADIQWQAPPCGDDATPSTNSRAYGRSLRSDGLEVELCLAEALTSADKDAIFALFEANMRAMYEGNRPSDGQEGPGGWDPASKQAELFDKESRLLLVWREPVGGEEPSTSGQEGATRTLAAFAMFRFDVEPCHGKDPANADRRHLHRQSQRQSLGRRGSARVRRHGSFPAITHREIEVLYLYELQVAREARATGLGSRLMALLVALAAHTEMRKVCLTTFLDNAPARRFYQRLGWSRDRTSPADSEGVAWEILSRPIGIYAQW